MRHRLRWQSLARARRTDRLFDRVQGFRVPSSPTKREKSRRQLPVVAVESSYTGGCDSCRARCRDETTAGQIYLVPLGRDSEHLRDSNDCSAVLVQTAAALTRKKALGRVLLNGLRHFEPQAVQQCSRRRLRLTLAACSQKMWMSGSVLLHLGANAAPLRRYDCCLHRAQRRALRKCHRSWRASSHRLLVVADSSDKACIVVKLLASAS